MRQGRSTPYIGEGHPTLKTGNPYNVYVNLYYWVDNHPHIWKSWEFTPEDILESWVWCFCMSCNPCLHKLRPMEPPQKKSLCQRSWVIHPFILFVILMVPRLNSWVTNLTLNPEVFTFVFFLNLFYLLRLLGHFFLYLRSSEEHTSNHIPPPPFSPSSGFGPPSLARFLNQQWREVTFIGRLTLVDAGVVAFKVNVLCECFFKRTCRKKKTYNNS